MPQPGNLVVSLVVCGAVTLGHAGTAAAEIAISARSTWELCKNMQPESTASAELRELSSGELSRRAADCGFLTKKSAPVKPLKAPAASATTVPLLEQGQDLLIRSQPNL